MTPDPYVGFLPRACAWGVDKLLLIALTALMAWLYPVAGLDWRALVACGAEAACWRPQLPLLADALVRWLIPATATVLFLTRLRATPGKLLLRAEVVDAVTGGTINTRQAWIRVAACALSYLTLGLGHLWMIVDARKQALHDKCAGTVVVRQRRSRSVASGPHLPR